MGPAPGAAPSHTPHAPSERAFRVLPPPALSVYTITPGFQHVEPLRDIWFIHLQIKSLVRASGTRTGISAMSTICHWEGKGKGKRKSGEREKSYLREKKRLSFREVLFPSKWTAAGWGEERGKKKSSTQDLIHKLVFSLSCHPGSGPNDNCCSFRTLCLSKCLA